MRYHTPKSYVWAGLAGGLAFWLALGAASAADATWRKELLAKERDA